MHAMGKLFHVPTVQIGHVRPAGLINPKAPGKCTQPHEAGLGAPPTACMLV